MRIFAGKLVNPGCVSEDVVVEVGGGQVVSVGSAAGKGPQSGDLDMRAGTLIPGLIDIHIHGAFGDDFTKGAVARASKHLASRGTTSFLPTMYPSDSRTWEQGLGDLRKHFEKQDTGGAKMLGVHLEGPFLNPRHGAQRAEYCWPVTARNVETILSQAGEALRMVSLSPELPGAAEAVRRFWKNGVTVGAAHTEADTEQMQVAYDCGLRHATHILNAMEAPPGGPKGVRRTGCVEFTLASEDMTADVMVDSRGVHVEDAWVKVLLKCLGVRRTALLSDSMLLSGLADGPHAMADGQRIRVAGGDDIVKREDGGIAGSVMMMLDALRNLMNRLGLRMEEALECATLTPARILGIERRKGSIEAGKDADLVVLDGGNQVLLTMVEGRVVFRRADVILPPQA